METMPDKDLIEGGGIISVELVSVNANLRHARRGALPSRIA
jgi:pyruvate/2-oxoglutarate dehydrogenase complex dihydrolipoamide dehydrogenase (E3) component